MSVVRGDAATRTTLMLRVAHLYHTDAMPQPEIARRLGLSQSRVSRLLTEAVRAGIVRTVVVTPPGTHAELESGLRRQLGLRDALVADVETDDPAAAIAAVGAMAADLLATTLRPGERIGVSSRSATLRSMSDMLPPLPAADAVVQVLGAIGAAQARAHSARLTERLAQATGAEPVYLPAPGVVSSAAVRAGLLDDEHVADALRACSGLTTVLTGIGSTSAAGTAAGWGEALPAADLARARASSAVGDVCLSFFDADGRPVDLGLADRTLGIDADTLRSVPRRIGVAAGVGKAAAIRGAALGGWIDTLVTDCVTARALLS